MSVDWRPRQDFWAWSSTADSVSLGFVGRSATDGHFRDPAAIRRFLSEDVEIGWLQQTHSATVVSARPGDNGPGDALITQDANLALLVVTADCVPILLSTEVEVAAVHAGWRGLAGCILPAAVQRLKAEVSEVKAWIGPTIGRCCYEVGSEVAEAVASASSTEIVHPGPRQRPHLDLAAAARWQLQQAGVHDVHDVEVCTRCDDRLWSYRRDGAGSGRNVAFIFRRA